MTKKIFTYWNSRSFSVSNIEVDWILVKYLDTVIARLKAGHFKHVLFNYIFPLLRIIESVFKNAKMANLDVSFWGAFVFDIFYSVLVYRVLMYFYNSIRMLKLYSILFRKVFCQRLALHVNWTHNAKLMQMTKHVRIMETVFFCRAKLVKILI